MSVKEIREAMEKGKVFFGARQALKNKGKLKGVFVVKDCRDSSVEKLEAAGIEFDVLKGKDEMAKELNLDFDSEVFSVRK